MCIIGCNRSASHFLLTLYTDARYNISTTEEMCLTTVISAASHVFWKTRCTKCVHAYVRAFAHIYIPIHTYIHTYSSLSYIGYCNSVVLVLFLVRHLYFHWCFGCASWLWPSFIFNLKSTQYDNNQCSFIDIQVTQFRRSGKLHAWTTCATIAKLQLVSCALPYSLIFII